MTKIIWYPPSSLYLREPLLQELQTLQRYALIDLAKDDIDGQPCFVIDLLPRDTCTDAQRKAIRRFRRWFMHHVHLADT